MHVPGERSCPAKAAQLRGGDAIGEEVGSQPAVRFRDADGEQAFGMHVAKILEGKARFPIVFLRARSEHPPAEVPCLLDKVGLKRSKPKCIRRENRRISLVAFQRVIHAIPVPRSSLVYSTSRLE